MIVRQLSKAVFTFLLIGVFVFINAQNHQSSQKLYTHLCELNTQWEQKNHLLSEKNTFGENDLNQVNQFSSHEDLIQVHLTLVEKTLRENAPAHLTKSQQKNRENGLNVLREYTQNGIFPKNTHHSILRPYFIDEFNTACAVGHIMRESGYKDLAHKIAETDNYAYIEEMNEPQLFVFADEMGFTVDELKWIQPAYGPSVFVSSDIIEPTCNNSDGEINIAVSPGWDGAPLDGVYTFDWNSGFPYSGSTFSNNQSLEDVAAGIYTLRVGGEGINFTDTFFAVSDDDGPQPTSIIQNNETCPYGNDGNIILNYVTDDIINVEWYNYEGEFLGTGTSLTDLSGIAVFDIINDVPPSFNYRAEITNSAGCKWYEQFLVTTENDAPYISNLNLAINSSQCGLSTGSIILGNVYAAEPYTALWSDGSTDLDRANLPSGTYTLAITDAVGCTTERIFSVPETCNGVTNYPYDVCENDFLTFGIPYTPNVIYQWSPTTGLSCPTCATTNVTATENITYTLTATTTVSLNSDPEIYTFAVNIDCETTSLDCEDSASLEWLNDFIDQISTTTDCNCFSKIEKVMYEGAIHYYADSECNAVDAPDIMLDCEGNQVCTLGGFTPGPYCGQFDVLETVWTCGNSSNQYCGYSSYDQIPFLQQPFIQNMGVTTYSYNGETVFYVQECDPYISDGMNWLADCDGNMICGWGGIAGFNGEGCEDFNFANPLEVISECNTPTECDLNADFQVTFNNGYGTDDIPQTEAVFTFDFTNTSTGNYQNLTWTCSCSPNTVEQDPVATFSFYSIQNGVPITEPYEVCLTVSNPNANTGAQLCEDTYCFELNLGGGDACINPSNIDFNPPCTFEYSPVCGCNGVTYDNPCLAENLGGVLSYTPGACGTNPTSCDPSVVGIGFIPDWLNDIIFALEVSATPNCACTEQIQQVMYNGEIAYFIDSNCNEVDAPDIMYDCEGNIICYHDGDTGPPYCGEWDVLTTLWSCSGNINCSPNQIPVGFVPDWLQDMINEIENNTSQLGSCDCVSSIDQILYDGEVGYFVSLNGQCLMVDAPNTMYDCEGNIVCLVSGAGTGFPTCGDFDILSNIPITCNENNSCLPNEVPIGFVPDWLEDMITDYENSTLGFGDCDCVASIDQVLYNGEVAYYSTIGGNCLVADIPNVMYDCEGNVICVSEGETAPPYCGDFEILTNVFTCNPNNTYPINPSETYCITLNSDFPNVYAGYGIDSWVFSAQNIGGTINFYFDTFEFWATGDSIAVLNEPLPTSFENYNVLQEITSTNGDIIGVLYYNVSAVDANSQGTFFVYDAASNTYIETLWLNFSLMASFQEVIQLLGTVNNCDNGTGNNSCDTSDLTWLEDMIENYSNPDPNGFNCFCSIEQWLYNGETVFYTPNTGCLDTPSLVYNCEGEIICSFGGLIIPDPSQTCEDFFQNAVFQDLILECPPPSEPCIPTLNDDDIYLSGNESITIDFLANDDLPWDCWSNGIYGSWLLTDISGGFSGGGLPVEGTHILTLNENGIVTLQYEGEIFTGSFTYDGEQLILNLVAPTIDFLPTYFQVIELSDNSLVLWDGFFDGYTYEFQLLPPQGELIFINEPEQGTFILNDDFTLTYTPNSGFAGADQIVYGFTYSDPFVFPPVEVITTATIFISGDDVPPICEFTNPIAELPWLNDLVENANCCFINTISQYDLYGEPVFMTNPSFEPEVNGVPCPTDIPNVLYNCNGEEICIYGFFPSGEGCVEIFNDLTNEQVIWSCGDGGTCNPDNLGWLQDQIESLSSQTAPEFCAVHEYIYNGETTYLFDSDYNFIDVPDVLYDCDGNYICAINGEIPDDEWCDGWQNAILVETLWQCDGNNECGFINDPINELPWLNDLVQGGNCCNTNSVSQFDLNGESVFMVYPDYSGGTNTNPCPADIPNVLYNCNGEEICSYGLIVSGDNCFDVLENLTNEEVIWTCNYDEVCDNPSDLEWLQNQIDNLSSQTDPEICSIQQYTLNGETTYLFESTNSIDEYMFLFNCLGDVICVANGLVSDDEWCDGWQNAILVETIWQCDDNNCIDESMIDPNFACIEIYSPVCGCDGVTYDNECYATYYGGVTSFTPGACNSLNNCGYTNPADAPWLENYLNSSFGDQITAYNYNGDLVYLIAPCEVYPDAMTSLLSCDGDFICGWGGIAGMNGEGCEDFDFSAIFLQEIQGCENVNECVNPDQIDLGVFCIEIYDPVCGCDGVTYSNECYAYNYGGVTSWTQGECGTTNPECDFAGGNPIEELQWLNDLVANANCCFINSIVQYELDGEPVFMTVPSYAGTPNQPCPTDLPSVLYNCSGEEICYYGFIIPDPSCLEILDDLTNEQTIWSCNDVNECVNPDQIDLGAFCTEVYTPVCGCDGVTYPNECYAYNYGGVTSWTQGECGTTNPNCDETINLVTAPYSPVTVCPEYCDLTPPLIITDVNGIAFDTSFEDSGDGCFTYTPFPGFVGIDEFSVVACDVNGNCNDITIIVETSIGIDCDETMELTIEPNQTINVCPEFCVADPFVAFIETYEGGENGTVNLNPDQNCFQYTPNQGFVGQDFILLYVFDANGDIVETYISIMIQEPEEPIIDCDEVLNVDVVVENAPPTTTVCPDFCDINLMAFSITSIQSNFTNATVSYTGATNDNCITYTPLPGFAGEEMVTVTACDAFGTCTEMTILFEVYTDGNQPTVDECESDECVWPGDANNDEVADNFDVLALGLAYDFVGEIRPNATLDWVGQNGPVWDANFAIFTEELATADNTGLIPIDDILVNLHHSDCDGNGVVNTQDLQAIDQNYGLETGKTEANNSDPDPNAPTIDLQFANGTTFNEGDTVYVNIVLTTPDGGDVDSLYGVAFDIEYGNFFEGESVIVENTVSVEYDENGWMATGANNSLTLDLSKQFTDDQKVETAFTRTNHFNTNGSGVIGQMHFVIDDNIVGKTGVEIPMEVAVKNAFKSTAEGFLIPLNVGLAEATITTGIEEDILEEVSIYPIPSKDFLNVNLGDANVIKMELVNALGQIVWADNNPQIFTQINVKVLPEGMYFLQMTTKTTQETKKVQVVR